MKGRTNPNKGRALPAEPLSRDEVEGLIRACSDRAPTGIRNQALITVLWRAGLRISEALAIYPKDLVPSQGAIRILKSKGGKSRVVGLDPGAWAVLRRWIDIRPSLRIDKRRRLFCTLAGNPLQTAYVRNLLPRLGGKAGIDKRVHPHGLRHTHACELRQENVDIGIISKQLGHSSTAVTARYLDHVLPQQVLETIGAREWTLQQPDTSTCPPPTSAAGHHTPTQAS